MSWLGCEVAALRSKLSRRVCECCPFGQHLSRSSSPTQLCSERSPCAERHQPMQTCSTCHCAWEVPAGTTGARLHPAHCPLAPSYPHRILRSSSSSSSSSRWRWERGGSRSGTGTGPHPTLTLATAAAAPTPQPATHPWPPLDQICSCTLCLSPLPTPTRIPCPLCGQQPHSAPTAEAVPASPALLQHPAPPAPPLTLARQAAAPFAPTSVRLPPNPPHRLTSGT